VSPSMTLTSGKTLRFRWYSALKAAYSGKADSAVSISSSLTPKNSFSYHLPLSMRNSSMRDSKRPVFSSFILRYLTGR
jgi:hypothetical protein